MRIRKGRKPLIRPSCCFCIMWVFSQRRIAMYLTLMLIIYLYMYNIYLYKIFCMCLVRVFFTVFRLGVVSENALLTKVTNDTITVNNIGQHENSAIS